LTGRDWPDQTVDSSTATSGAATTRAGSRPARCHFGTGAASGSPGRPSPSDGPSSGTPAPAPEPVRHEATPREDDGQRGCHGPRASSFRHYVRPPVSDPAPHPPCLCKCSCEVAVSITSWGGIRIALGEGNTPRPQGNRGIGAGSLTVSSASFHFLSSRRCVCGTG
jgi:hypothetical protein